VRELLLLPTVVGLCMAGLINPRIGVLGYVWFSLMRPDLLSWAPNRPYSIALAATTVLGSLREMPLLITILKSPIIVGFIAMEAVIAASVFAAVNPALSWGPWILYVKMLAVLILIPVLIQTEALISALIQVMAFSTGALATKYGVFSVVTGGARVYHGIEGSFLSDNNTLALVFVTAVPLCWYARLMTRFRLLRWMFTLMSLFSVAAVASSFSRGAALSLVAVFVWIAIRSRRKIVVVAMLVVIGLGAVAVVGDAYLDRLSTLKDPSKEGSAANRMEYTRAGILMWKDYPMLGVGFGMMNQRWLLRRYTTATGIAGDTGGPGQVIHNTYVQMLTDSGIFAFLLYIALVLGSIWSLARSVSQHRKWKTGLEMYPLALESTLVGYAVGSTFLSRVHFDLIYMLLFAAASWQIYQKNCPVESQQFRPVPVPQPGQFSPLCGAIPRPAVAGISRQDQPADLKRPALPPTTAAQRHYSSYHPTQN
jgi:probable O-glycosylation ligase (exosortase A-associated)